MKTKKIPFVRIVVEDGEVSEVIKNGSVDVFIETVNTKWFGKQVDTTFETKEN